MILIKSARELDLMSKSGELLGGILADVEKEIRPGVTTEKLNAWVDDKITKAGAKPSFKGYRGFPAAACISVNEEVVHGIPTNERVLNEGDIVGIDIGTFLHGYHADAARTFAVGEISQSAKQLIATTKESFFAGIEKAVVGARIGDISNAVQQIVERDGYSVVRELTGHGIGSELHEDPSIPNFGAKGKGPRLKAGMTLAVEPMVNEGDYNVRMLSDGWTIVTKDKSLSAHYENTIAITPDGPPLILTLKE